MVLVLTPIEWLMWSGVAVCVAAAFAVVVALVRMALDV
jgi:hypothetical protein